MPSSTSACSASSCASRARPCARRSSCYSRNTTRMCNGWPRPSEATMLPGGDIVSREAAVHDARETVHDAATALPRFRAFAEAHPHVAEARYAIGQILLRQGDDSGIAMIDAVMRQDPNAIKPGSVLNHEFLMERGRAAVLTRLPDAEVEEAARLK